MFTSDMVASPSSKATTIVNVRNISITILTVFLLISGSLLLTHRPAVLFSQQPQEVPQGQPSYPMNAKRANDATSLGLAAGAGLGLSPPTGGCTPAAEAAGGSSDRANETIVDPPARHENSNYRAWKTWNANFFKPFSVRGMNSVALSLNENAWDGGSNFDQNGYINKSNWMPFDLRLNKFTSGQGIPANINVNNYGDGDALALSLLSNCYAGESAGGDEGCEALDRAAVQGGVEFHATISSGGTTGATSLTLSPTAGSGTQGSGRYLIDMAPGKTLSSGTITSLRSAQGGAPPTLTGSGTSWPVSTVNTTLGTAVTVPGPATVTPGSTAGITTSTVLCVADPGAYETVMPSAVTGRTFTATFAKPHVSTAIVSAGGLCGYFFEFAADRYEARNTLHWIWPIIRSTSPTSADVWFSTPGVGYQGGYGGRASFPEAAYVMYPGAEVTSVQTGGAAGNTFTLSPNNTAWSNSDAVALPHYPWMHIMAGHTTLTKYFPSPGAEASSGTFTSLNGIWSKTTGDGADIWQNATLTTFYRGGGNGVLIPPDGFHFIGPWSSGLRMDAAPSAAESGYVMSLGCPWTTKGCVDAVGIIFNKNSSGYDYMLYDPTNDNYVFSAKNRTGNYTFGASQFKLPGAAQIVSTIATGTAPLAIASTTPVANLAATPTTYNAAGKQQTKTHIVEDTCTLGTNCSVTLSGPAAFTGAGTYRCAATDTTAANAIHVSQTSGSAVAFTGTGTDVINFICVGY